MEPLQRGAQCALPSNTWPNATPTNAQLYRSPSQHHTLLVAERQTHGRGQFERVWRSQAGDLIFRWPEFTFDAIPALSIRVGLAFGANLNPNGWPVQLKWPNDLIT